MRTYRMMSVPLAILISFAIGGASPAMASAASTSPPVGSQSDTTDFVVNELPLTPNLEVEEGEKFLLAVAEKVVSDEGVGTRVADLIVCTGKYDFPHPSNYSNGTKINAHLAVTCVGGGAINTHVRVQSRMTEGIRIGPISTKQAYRYVRTGGELACLNRSGAYTAVGTASITFPVGYTPSYKSMGARSLVGTFKMGAAGKCVVG